jgi:hypothetical protein
MTIFGIYFTKNMLDQMGWPRKQGLFSREVFDTYVFDSTIDQMVDWAAAIGAGNPKLSLKIIAYIFRDRDWKSNDCPDIKKYITELSKRYEKTGIKLEEKAPHEIVRLVRFSAHTGKTMPAAAFQNKDVQLIIETDFLNGLLYGLGSSASFESWYESHLEDARKNMPTMRKAGLEIDELPTLKENYVNSEQIIRDYEKMMEITLPEIPAKLLSDAKALGIKIN